MACAGMESDAVIRDLEARAARMRRLSAEMTYCAGSQGGHIGPAYSIIDIVAALYFHTMNYRVDQPDWADRDRFILSKGHAVLAQYTALAVAGLIDEAELHRFEGDHTRLAGHPCAKGVPGIECPSGSLGHGLSIGAGMAKAAKMNGRRYRTFVIVGDGESEEGSIWEAAMFAAQYKLDNLVCIVDANGFQYGGKTRDMINPEPIADKWRAFGWHVIECDGHDFTRLLPALDASAAVPGMPTCIVARTVKGKGVSFMENDNQYHHARISEDAYTRAMAELEG